MSLHNLCQWQAVIWAEGPLTFWPAVEGWRQPGLDPPSLQFTPCGGGQEGQRDAS